MKSATWICIISVEIVLSVVIASAIALQWYCIGDPPAPVHFRAASPGHPNPSACPVSRSMPLTNISRPQSPKPIGLMRKSQPSSIPRLETWTRRIIAMNSTRKGNRRMDLRKISDIDIATATICAEAGGEPWGGKVLVGEAIANRAAQYGGSIRAACLAPKAFSCWNNLGTMFLRMQTMRAHPSWNDCQDIAKIICQPDYKTSSPVTHYVNLSKCSPPWAKRMKRVAVVGAHTFFCLR